MQGNGPQETKAKISYILSIPVLLSKEDEKSIEEFMSLLKNRKMVGSTSKGNSFDVLFGSASIKKDT